MNTTFINAMENKRYQFGLLQQCFNIVMKDPNTELSVADAKRVSNCYRKAASGLKVYMNQYSQNIPEYEVHDSITGQGDEDDE